MKFFIRGWHAFAILFLSSNKKHYASFYYRPSHSGHPAGNFHSPKFCRDHYHRLFLGVSRCPPGPRAAGLCASGLPACRGLFLPPFVENKKRAQTTNKIKQPAEKTAGTRKNRP